jgi:hypothetical protein
VCGVVVYLSWSCCVCGVVVYPILELLCVWCGSVSYPGAVVCGVVVCPILEPLCFTFC